MALLQNTKAVFCSQKYKREYTKKKIHRMEADKNTCWPTLCRDTRPKNLGTKVRSARRTMKSVKVRSEEKEKLRARTTCKFNKGLSKESFFNAMKRKKAPSVTKISSWVSKGEELG